MKSLFGPVRKAHDAFCIGFYDMFKKRSPSWPIHRAATLISMANGLVVLSLFLAVWAPERKPTAMWWLAGGLIIATYAQFVEKRLSVIADGPEKYVPSTWRRRSRYLAAAYLVLAFVSPFMAAIFGRHPG